MKLALQLFIWVPLVAVGVILMLIPVITGNGDGVVTIDNTRELERLRSQLANTSHALRVAEAAAESAEAQLAVYEGEKTCLPMTVVAESIYGAGVVSIAETEFCGLAVAINDQIFGPSMAAYIATAKAQIADFNAQGGR